MGPKNGGTVSAERGTETELLGILKMMHEVVEDQHADRKFNS